MKKKGVSAIIYDNNGAYYFLILHRKSNWNGWEFPKTGLLHEQELTEQEELSMLQKLLGEMVGISKYSVKSKFSEKRQFTEGDREREFSVFLVETSMNIPVKLNSEKHATYLWAKKDSVMEKLTWDSEIKVFIKAHETLSNS